MRKSTENYNKSNRLIIWQLQPKNQTCLKLLHSPLAVFYNPKSSRIKVADASTCRDFPHPHTGLRIRQLFEQISIEYDLDVKKVIRFTTDKGANVVNALQPYKVVQYVKLL